MACFPEELEQSLSLDLEYEEIASLISLMEEALLLWEEGLGNDRDNDNSQPPASCAFLCGACFSSSSSSMPLDT
jgi:hypothetical protein